VIFEIDWKQDGKPRHDRMVVRMDPAESHNATSRLREAELLRAFRGIIRSRRFSSSMPMRVVPGTGADLRLRGRRHETQNHVLGAVSGLGIHFGPELRARLGLSSSSIWQNPSYRIADGKFTTMEHHRSERRKRPAAANRARRVWEEDRGEDVPLMDVATNWLAAIFRHGCVSVVHGDYRSGNFLFDEASGQITTWLDWERGTSGSAPRPRWITQAMFGDPREDGQGFYIWVSSGREFTRSTSGCRVSPSIRSGSNGIRC